MVDSPREKKLPEEKNQAQRVAYRAARLMGDVLHSAFHISNAYAQARQITCSRKSTNGYVGIISEEKDLHERINRVSRGS